MSAVAVRAKSYDVLQMAVENGVSYGWTRAHKHVDKPDEDKIKEQIFEHVMSSICEWFEFDGDRE